MEAPGSRGHLLTEQSNPNSRDLDRLTALELVDLFNGEDACTLSAIAAARLPLAQAIDATSLALRDGGRLFYVGAGTSGRLGVLDAAECPPTFCTPPELVQGIIAGGREALVRSAEGLEDRSEDGASAIAQRGVRAGDIVAGISAGGTTPFVVGALQAARAVGATTLMLACVPAEQANAEVDIDIRLLVGPEVLAGSTRLKAGTATKMALNILSTGVMVRLGKTSGNRMVDVAATNAKLRDRAQRMVEELTDLDGESAARLLADSNYRVKHALLMHWGGIDLHQAERLLEAHQGNLRAALSSV